MTPEQTLHTYARRYLIERSHKWTSEYWGLAAEGRDRRGADYTPEAYATFPRYNVLHAILLDVESLDFDQLPCSQELSELLIVAGQTATTVFVGNLPNATAQNAEQEERNLFVDAIRSAVADGPPEQQPLHYRRTLSAQEVVELRGKLAATWGITKSYWYPLDTKSHPSLVAFELAKIDEPALQLEIKHFLRKNGVQRILELREFGPENYCVQAGVEDLFYGTGGEGFWVSDTNDWIVYCSHEGTITLGGTITTIAPGDPLGPD